MPESSPDLLVAVDGAELGQPHGQVAVAARLRRVDLDVVRAVHRLEQVTARRRRHLDRRELPVLVVRIMPRGLVQMHVAETGV